MSWLELNGTSLRVPTCGDNTFGALSAERAASQCCPWRRFSPSGFSRKPRPEQQCGVMVTDTGGKKLCRDDVLVPTTVLGGTGTLRVAQSPWQGKDGDGDTGQILLLPPMFGHTTASPDPKTQLAWCGLWGKSTGSPSQPKCCGGPHC